MNIIKYPRRVKARTQHICDTCQKVIKVGEEYEYATYSESGKIYDWRTCDRCKQYVDEAFLNKDYSWDDGMSEEEFRNYMWEEHREIAEEWWKLN